MGFGWVGESIEYGAGVMVAVHWDEGCYMGRLGILVDGIGGGES